MRGPRECGSCPSKCTAQFIYVSTRNHVVYLSGMADTRLETEEAEEIARQVPDVAQVVSTVGVEQ
jgi:osmotically-inducible protein OsmY